MGRLIAGASNRGEFEQRLINLISEVKRSEGKIILFIDELHTLIGAGGGGNALDAANIMKPALARGELTVSLSCHRTSGVRVFAVSTCVCVCVYRSS